MLRDQTCSRHDSLLTQTSIESCESSSTETGSRFRASSRTQLVRLRQLSPSASRLLRLQRCQAKRSMAGCLSRIIRRRSAGARKSERHGRLDGPGVLARLGCRLGSPFRGPTLDSPAENAEPRMTGKPSRLDCRRDRTMRRRGLQWQQCHQRRQRTHHRQTSSSFFREHRRDQKSRRSQRNRLITVIVFYTRWCGGDLAGLL